MLKTRDRIIQAGLQLFNEHGDRLVTTNHIAASLGISPGNLYYHFRNKEEIILAIFLEYREYISKRLQAPIEDQANSDFMSHYLDAVFDTLWRYRFLFYDLPGLLARDPNLAELHQGFERSIIVPSLIAVYRRLTDLGWFNMPEEDLVGLVLNAQVISNNWYSFERTLHPTASMTEATSKRAIGQILLMLRPYVTEPFRGQFETLEARFRYNPQALLSGETLKEEAAAAAQQASA